MSDNGTRRRPKVWGRRPYAGKEARELLNDISRYIQRTRPADVDDPDDPTLSDVLRHATDPQRRWKGQDNHTAVDLNADTAEKSNTLTNLMSHGLDFQETVCWYWFRYCRFDVTEIHYAIEGRYTGGDAGDRKQSVRNILGVLRSAASKLPDESESDVPDLVDERKRHDRTDDGAKAADGDADAGEQTAESTPPADHEPDSDT